MFHIMDKEYISPSCSVYKAMMCRELCVSVQALPPVVEEDAGIIEWED